MRLLPPLVLVVLHFHCIGIVELSRDQRARKPYEWLLGLVSRDNSGLPAPDASLSAPPVLSLPAGVEIAVFSVTESAVSIPRRIGNAYVPVGKTYDIGIDITKIDPDQPLPQASIAFPSDVAELTYTYDGEALVEAGFLEEFKVWYFDAPSSSWKSSGSVTVDTEMHTVRAQVSHFTP